MSQVNLEGTSKVAKDKPNYEGGESDQGVDRGLDYDGKDSAEETLLGMD